MRVQLESNDSCNRSPTRRSLLADTWKMGRRSMKWEDFKYELKWEWQFHKRNPELLILMLIIIGMPIYFIFKEMLCKN